MLIGQTADLLFDGEFDRTGTLVEIQPETPNSNGLGFECDKIGLLFYPYSDVIFHLRRLESITEEEARELYKISRGEEWDYEYNSYAANRDRGMGKIWSCLENWWMGNYEMFAENGNWLIGDPNAWLYLISKGFDLFGLIDKGLAKEIKS